MLYICKVWFYYHFWNYFYDKKKLFSRTQYAKREAVDGDKEAKVSDERHKLVQEMAMF